MTKKHFIRIAATINELHGRVGADAGTLKAIAEALATEFKAINPNFDRTRFLTACGF